MKFKDILPWESGSKEVAKPEDHPFFSLHKQMNEMFENFEKNFGLDWPKMPETDTGLWRVDMDISESDHDYTLEAELPGLKPNDVEIKVEGNMLRITGEKKQEEEKKNKTWRRIERRYGSFQRMLQLPPEADVDRIDADFKDGVLKITVPKTHEAVESAKRIPINA